MDQDLIVLTHVCRGWRNILISRSSLWTRLDFASIEKIRTYIRRSKSSPLKFYLGYNGNIDDVFPLMIPHIHRLKSLTVNTRALPSILRHFRCHTPLLEKLDINSVGDPVLDGTLFNGDLSSLRELRLHRVVTQFPWKNLANLRVVDLNPHFHRYGTTQILNFFESAPLLHTVSLRYPMPDYSDAPPGRIVSLRHLNVFTINSPPPHSALLHHLHIPTGASLVSEFCFNGEESPLLGYLPERPPNFSNLSHIITVNLLFNSWRKFVQLSGPSGSLRVLAAWEDWRTFPSHTIDYQILRSLRRSMLPTVQKLVISKYQYPRPVEAKECPIFPMLSSANNLRTLVLINCNNLPFVLALDPEQNPSNPVICPNMEELVFYIISWDQFSVKRVASMAKNRASRGAKLSSIVFSSLGELAPRKEVSKLREHVTHVVCKFGDAVPAWDDIPGKSGGENE